MSRAGEYTDNEARARALVGELGLDRAPVALAFLETAPAGLATADYAVPSACTFWRLAETALFYASAERHYECPIGAMTMGFELPTEHQSAAQQLVGTMVELGYFGVAEVPHLPSVQKGQRGILYGPLARFPVEPDLVLAIATPRQAMLLAEAGDMVTLRESGGLTAMGRPACAAVARAATGAEVTLSLGCIGARTYVEVPEDRAVVVIPGPRLEALVERLGPLNRANAALADFHAGRKAQFPTPTPATSAGVGTSERS